MTSFGFSAGFHGLFLTGVRGCSGSSTVKVLLNGHGVFSNKSTFSSTSFSASTCAFSSSFSLGTSMRQYCGGRICRTNLPDPSTSQHCDFGSMGRKACEQFKKATDPGARYMLKGPTMDQSASGSAKGGVQSDDICTHQQRLFSRAWMHKVRSQAHLPPADSRYSSSAVRSALLLS